MVRACMTQDPSEIPWVSEYPALNFIIGENKIWNHKYGGQILYLY
jgi:hypothetical protein